MKFRLKALLVVLVLLGVSVALFLRHAQRQFIDERYDIATAQIASLEMKLRAFHEDTGTLPTELQGLLAPDGSPHWNGPYAKDVELVDPGRHPIQYTVIDKAKPVFRLSIVKPDGSIVSTQFER